MNCVIDTNVVSEWMRPAPDPQVMSWLDRLDEDAAHLSVVTLGELRFGVEKLPAGQHRQRLDDWLSVRLAERFEGRVLAVDAEIADTWGRLTAACAMAGRPLSAPDGLVAATALCHDLTVVTRNVKDFEPTGVAVHNPWLG